MVDVQASSPLDTMVRVATQTLGSISLVQFAIPMASRRGAPRQWNNLGLHIMMPRTLWVHWSPDTPSKSVGDVWVSLSNLTDRRFFTRRASHPLVPLCNRAALR